MEFSLCSLDSALPVEVTVDEDNGRYMIRKSDTSGEYFNSADELIEWVKANFTAEEFCDPGEYHGMIQKLTDYLVDPNF
ncbi:MULTISPECIES: hypothetical protein [unclassified Cytobacillus]|uniref:hypothetical protein n=1 Tax=unclassified Cytobacillus TaxID=2675268 RepID=UPI0013568A6B|nr:hypothetical protein [Cytobacillus sp. AMY 15.2]KAF0818675.1 threonine dehydratase [Bacillus sp. ZZV12-4809]MCM3091189.1 hypothetical protein [Cytobacillus sp. AMY 15.2]